MGLFCTKMQQLARVVLRLKQKIKLVLGLNVVQHQEVETLYFTGIKLRLLTVNCQ